MGNLWKNYNLAIVLLALFLVSWALQAVFQWQEFASNQQMHQQAATLSGFMPEFWRSTFENWQSEFLQLFSMVVLTSFLVFKGSAESRDSQDQMQQQLNEIQKQLNKSKK